jgi:hypothetical protein
MMPDQLLFQAKKQLPDTSWFIRMGVPKLAVKIAIVFRLSGCVVGTLAGVRGRRIGRANKLPKSMCGRDVSKKRIRRFASQGAGARLGGASTFSQRCAARVPLKEGSA